MAVSAVSFATSYDEPVTTPSGQRDQGGRPDENTRPRQVRISDGLWQAAKQQAAKEGTTVADVVRDFLVKWTEYDGPAVHGREYAKRDPE